MKLRLEIDKKSIDKLIKDLEDYKLSLTAKSQMFVDRLMDEGIQVAYQHLGKYTGYVEFTKEIDSQGSQTIGMLIGKDSKPFISTWMVKGGVKSVEVSGLLMSEFGSGWLANVIWNVQGVGQGTFPGQKHAFQSQWFWRDEAGNLHVSKGELPSYPMYSADMAMLSQIDTIAREVFKHG